ncbi:MAG TPA: GNAT family N-acetyltransferase [Gaiellaceae bacterium]|nr:GNAT family N-acetyltransferase [Gaiellaceae bacterium]
MVETAIDTYCDAFVARNRHELDRPVVRIAPGVRGVAHVRLLVTDDSGYDRLVAEVSSAQPGVVFVFDRASRCNRFLGDRPGWSARTEMAMVLRDIRSVKGKAALPDGLDLRPVDRVGSGAPDAVRLTDAVAAAIASDPGITDSPDRVAEYLSGLPPSVQLFAAVDETGVARATSACHVFGPYAQVFFVSTEPAWRRRGIGGAMTACALRGAAALGARSALLHSTADGASLYKRLGFEAVGLLTRYSYAD